MCFAGRTEYLVPGRGSNAGHSSAVAGVDARRATPPEPRLARWGLAGCRLLDPSHSAAKFRELNHTPARPLRPWVSPFSTAAASTGDLRLAGRRGLETFAERVLACFGTLGAADNRDTKNLFLRRSQLENLHPWPAQLKLMPTAAMRD